MDNPNALPFKVWLKANGLPFASVYHSHPFKMHHTKEGSFEKLGTTNSFGLVTVNFNASKA